MADEWNNWQRIADAMTPACVEAVTKTAQAGEAHVAAQIIANGQVDTGNMLKSVYSSAPFVSTYNYDVKRALLEVDPESDTEAILAVAADYAIFPNYGTVHQPANPFWEPALEEVKSDFDLEMWVVAQKLEKAGR